jgi:hypothetical protein
MATARRQQTPTSGGAAQSAPPAVSAERSYHELREELLAKRYCDGRLKLAPAVGLLQIRELRTAVNEVRSAVGAALPTGASLSIDGIIDLFADAATDYIARLYDYVLVTADSLGWTRSEMARVREIIETHNLDIEEMEEVRADFFALHPRAIAMLKSLWSKLSLAGVTMGEMAGKLMTVLSMSSSFAPASPMATPPDTTPSSTSTIPTPSASPSDGSPTAEMTGSAQE